MNELKDILDIYNNQHSISNDLWSLYIAVSTGLAGLVFAKENISKFSLVVLSILYIGFAISNQQALIQSQKVLFESHKYFQNQTNYDNSRLLKVAKKIQVSEPKNVRTFHILLTSIIVLCFWLPATRSYYSIKRNKV